MNGEIDHFVNEFNVSKFLNHFYLNMPIHERITTINHWNHRREEFRQIWKENPRLSVGELLIRGGLISPTSFLAHLKIDDPIWSVINRRDLPYTLTEITQGIIVFLVQKQMTRQPITIEENIQLIANIIIWINLQNQSSIPPKQ